ncbi:MAG: glycoside hydrolase family 36 protein [Lentisphaeria bacterium]
MKIKSTIGIINIRGDLGKWNILTASECPKSGIEYIHFKLNSEQSAPLPEIWLEWQVPQLDMQTRWHPACGFNRSITPSWGSSMDSNLAHSAPVLQLGNICGRNRLLFAVSEAIRTVKIKAGVCEETNEITCSVGLFTVLDSSFSSYEFTLVLDIRDVFYAEAIRDVFAWFTTFPKYTPSEVPKAALEPLYSSWYSYHQDVHAHQLEFECSLAQKYGIKSIIVDDGWQTDNNNRGYSFCGDWEISTHRFPDMRAHIAAVHQLGMKYMMWYSVPFIGEKSKNVKRFAGKYLYKIDEANAYVLDPRFPEIRQFLIGIYVKALKEWDLDGFKLDFIDRFCFKKDDPAINENYAGRDIKSLPEAVDQLLSDVMTQLKKIKPDIMIEFRQSYIGPAIRKYGNMFRSSDCPGDILRNRLNTIDLRLTSGNTAVHSDMIEWNYADHTENAALQLLNIIFSVPQISVRLSAISKPHQRMLHFWLTFWRVHRDVLMNGTLMPFHPELNYPLVIAENDLEKVIAVYSSDQLVKIQSKPGQKCYIINASGTEELFLKLDGCNTSGKLFDVTGNLTQQIIINKGFNTVYIPRSGLLKLQF